MAFNRFDIFFTVAASKEKEEKEVKEFLSVHDDMLFMQELQILFSDKFLERSGTMLKYNENNQNASILFSVLSFAVANDINYNNYISSPMLIFLEQTYNQSYFNLTHINQSEDLKHINISILRKDGFLLIMDDSPFRGKVIQNSFLDIMLKLNRRSVMGHDRARKAQSVEAMIGEHMMRKQMAAKMGISQVSSPKPQIPYFESDNPVKGVFLSLTKEQKAIKAILSIHNQDALNLTYKTYWQKAQNMMRHNVTLGKGFTVEMLIEYHKVLMNDPEIGGIFRAESVSIAGNPHFKVCNFNKIQEALKKLLERYQKSKFKGLPEVIKFGSYLHNELQHIHPFVDGNTRLTRLVLQHFFALYRLPDFEVPVVYISKYSSLTKGARHRDDNKLFELFKEIFLYMLCNASSAVVQKV